MGRMCHVCPRVYAVTGSLLRAVRAPARLVPAAARAVRGVAEYAVRQPL